MKRDATGFWGHTHADTRFWVDDPNIPMRMIVERAPNRLQAYQRDAGHMLSMGYCLTPQDARTFLRGDDAQLYAEFGIDGPFRADLAREPLRWSSQTLHAWLADASSAETAA